VYLIACAILALGSEVVNCPLIQSVAQQLVVKPIAVRHRAGKPERGTMNGSPSIEYYGLSFLISTDFSVAQIRSYRRTGCHRNRGELTIPRVWALTAIEC